MKILVLNCGSSSLKYQFLDMNTEEALATGLCERIGIDGKHKYKNAKGEKVEIDPELKNHTDAINSVLEMLTNAETGVIKDMGEINAIGHRVVHGGEEFTKSVLITEEVKKAIEACCELAPLHNPPNLTGIEVCEKLMPGVPQVAVFDTAFHQTMEPTAYLYALPYELYENHKVRRYGFHGTSHFYVTSRVADMMGKKIEDLKIISCHLGNGASVAAVQGGKCVDTSMGFTPLEGLVMGTRAGDMDPAIVNFVMEKEGLSIEEVTNMLNKESGVHGISGVSSDFRDIEEAASKGNKRAQIALDMFIYRVSKYIGAYAAAMNGVDAIVFTAGLGENGIPDRAAILDRVSFLGVECDNERNNVRGKETEISTADSKVKAFVIPTNEELVIARDTKKILDK